MKSFKRSFETLIMEDDRLCLSANFYNDLSGESELHCNDVPAQRKVVDGKRNRGNERVIEVIKKTGNETRIGEVQIIYENEISRRVSMKLKSLPPGKKYHVFFSHSREDREWVLRMVNKLESPQYGFKCCFADRDFDLGCPVFENITKFVNLSKKTVVVLSPEFLESPWCSYETRITMEMDLDTRQRLLVPVMLRSCTVPSFIGRLSYIEVQNEHFWHRFLQTLMEDTNERYNEPIGSDAIIGSRPFQFNPNFFSSEIISEVTAYDGRSCYSESSPNFMPNELMRNGLQLTEDDFKGIMKSVGGTCFVRCHGFYTRTLHWTLLAVIQFVHLICFLVFYFIEANQAEPKFFATYICLSTWVGTTFLMVMIRLVTTIKAIKSLSEAVVEANRIGISRDMMVSLKDYGCCHCACDRISIIFMYYDWRPCQSYMERLLLDMRQQSTNEPRIRIEENEEHVGPSLNDSLLNLVQEDLEDLEFHVVESILLKHATEYGQLLHSRRTLNPSEKRHTRQGECLCQFIESILVSGKRSCLDRIYGVTQRHPWRRLIEI